MDYLFLIRTVYWQLPGVRGHYGMYVVITGYTWQPSSKRHVDPVTAT